MCRMFLVPFFVHHFYRFLSMWNFGAKTISTVRFFLLVWFGFRLLLQEFSLLHMGRKDFKVAKSHMYVQDTDFQKINDNEIWMCFQTCQKYQALSYLKAITTATNKTTARTIITRPTKNNNHSPNQKYTHQHVQQTIKPNRRGFLCFFSRSSSEASVNHCCAICSRSWQQKNPRWWFQPI